MSRCQASIQVGKTTKPIEVLFSSGAQNWYISELVAVNLKLPIVVEETPTTIESASGQTSNRTKTASINLALDTFQHVVNVVVVPGGLPYLVLGREWF